MKNDFKKMEDEMDCLSANMTAITEFSAKISGTLQDQHAQITKLSGKKIRDYPCIMVRKSLYKPIRCPLFIVISIHRN